MCLIPAVTKSAEIKLVSMGQNEYNLSTGLIRDWPFVPKLIITSIAINGEANLIINSRFLDFM